MSKTLHQELNDQIDLINSLAENITGALEGCEQLPGEKEIGQVMIDADKIIAACKNYSQLNRR